ncbi:MAG: hypothetical protein IJG63_07160 [Oscillospiraceae bacterium]|nr:hypothetical protein [Oscillospiraceae bacterium]
MKKIISLILAMLFVLAVLSACGPSGDEASEPDAGASDTAAPETSSEDTDAVVASLETIGDAMAAALGGNEQYAAYDGKFIYVFDLDGTSYRVIASVPNDVFESIMALDYADEDYDAKYSELVTPLAIERYENLSQYIPAQEELDKLVGKTGQDLLDDGWTNWGYSLDTMEFWMHKEPFAYTVVFDGQLELTDDFDADEAIKPLTVKSVTYDGLGDATNLDEISEH